MSRYRKALVAVLAGVVAVVDQLAGPSNEWSQLIVSLAGALGVYGIPNEGGEG